MIYLDYNATAPMKPAVRVAMMEAMERAGNPSSVHRYGRIARKHIEEARAQVAALVGVKPAQVIFTGSGTEANNMAIHAAVGSAVIISAIEHESIRACAPSAQPIPVTDSGVVDLEAAEEIFSRTQAPALVAVMLVNNETGAIQPVAEIVRLAAKYGHRVHTDAVQAAGRIPLDFKGLGVCSLSLSAHKIGGPQGVGALIVADQAVMPRFIQGGGQEMNRRAGTENVAGIIGFGVAAQLEIDDLRDMPRLRAWRDGMEAQIQAIGGSDAVIVGADAPYGRVANTLCVAMRNVSSETQVMAMDLAGIAVSAGSACSSGKVKASHVLLAMGLEQSLAGSALRISLGWNTQPGDVAKCVEAWRALYQRAGNQSQSVAA